MTRLDDLRLTTQELAHLADAAHLLAAQARADLERQENPAMRKIFADAEQVYLELGRKCERMRALATT